MFSKNKKYSLTGKGLLPKDFKPSELQELGIEESDVATCVAELEKSKKQIREQVEDILKNSLQFYNEHIKNESESDQR